MTGGGGVIVVGDAHGADRAMMAEEKEKHDGGKRKEQSKTTRGD